MLAPDWSLRVYPVPAINHTLFHLLKIDCHPSILWGAESAGNCTHSSMAQEFLTLGLAWCFLPSQHSCWRIEVSLVTHRLREQVRGCHRCQSEPRGSARARSGGSGALSPKSVSFKLAGTDRNRPESTFPKWPNFPALTQCSLSSSAPGYLFYFRI